MKRKDDPQIKQIKHLVKVLGPVIEDFEIRRDQVTEEFTVAFTSLDLVRGGEGDAPEFREFELSPERAFWYLSGVVNGAAALINAPYMAALQR